MTLAAIGRATLFHAPPLRLHPSSDRGRRPYIGRLHIFSRSCVPREFLVVSSHLGDAGFALQEGEGSISPGHPQVGLSARVARERIERV
jgi:hypothetical protein